jgi:hypothetical protein
MEGEKDVLRIGRVTGALLLVGLVGVGIVIATSFHDDTSFLGKTDHPISSSVTGSSSGPPQSKGHGKVGSMLQNSEANRNGNRPRERRGPGMKINYRAQQVLESNNIDPSKSLPMGTNLIGKTLTTIDTRDAGQLIKVLLPYGGRAGAGGELPKNTIVFGQIAYNGKGEKVFLKFSKGLLPDGKEFQLEAQGLSPADYSSGIVGRFHGTADVRIASNLGLTMVSAMSDVLTEKESIGGGLLQGATVAPKANMKNALYHGVSQAAQNEANRQAESIGQTEEYVTVDAGTDIIVSLTKAYNGK